MSLNRRGLVSALFAILAMLPVGSVRADEQKPGVIRVVVWDEQQPAQKKVYDNFLGNAIADYLKGRPGFSVRSVRLDDPDQGLSDDVLDHCDVLVWWGHIRNRDLSDDNGKRVLERIMAGKLSLITLHSAHWSKPFVQAMWERSKEDALKSLPEEKRKTARLELVNPMLYLPPRRNAPFTPSFKTRTNDDGTETIILKLPVCCFPAYRADGKPSHITTLLPQHPIAQGIPEHFDIPQTEMYDEPFHVPQPDEVVFEEHWDKGEHFRSGCVWKIGKGKVFYFRPGHEIYPIYKQPVPLKIVENATRWLAAQLPNQAG